MDDVVIPDSVIRSTEVVIPDSVIRSTQEYRESQAPVEEAPYEGEVVIPESVREISKAYGPRYNEDTFGEKAGALAIEALEGLTLGWFGELAAMAQAAVTDKEYDDIKTQYEEARILFREKNPELEQYILPLEFAASVPTGVGLFRVLGKAGIESVAKRSGIEAGLYGAGQGESFEERVILGTTLGLTGATIGKAIQLATRGKNAGGLKDADTSADDKLDLLSDAERRAAIKEEEWTERALPDYNRVALRDAKTVGEFWNSAVTGFKKFYDDKVTGASDAISRYMPEIGFRFQRANETALREINKKMDDLAEGLLPTIRLLNEDKAAKGLFLDYAKGALGKTEGENYRALIKGLETKISSDSVDALTKYLQYSRDRNRALNFSVFGINPTMFVSPTYLHTRNRSIAKAMREEGLDELEIEKRLFNDSGMGRRSREDFSKGNVNADDYDNPLLSDMSRLFQLENLGQLQRVYALDINEEIAFKRVKQVTQAKADRTRPPKYTYLTPSEFMDALEMSFYSKGISMEGAEYAANKIADTIMGAQKAPHPLIQGASSFAYGTTLAGPMSAFLNIADVPLLGAKYGGAAVLEGLNVLNPFKKVPNIDLKKAGLDNQVMGEFTDKLNDEMRDGASGYLMRTVAGLRKGTDLLMKGSGFAAMDRIGKKGVIRGVLKSAVDDANAGKLADNWGFYFNRKELDLIEQQFKKHGTDHTKYTGEGKKLAEELMFAGLGQQQLISSAGRPAAWARNPNLRPLWALRGFVVKQQALALREVVGNIKAGNPEKAAEFLGRYALYGAGGYAVINETRQGIFGDGDFSAGGLVRGYGDAWASLLTANTLGLNDYQFGQIQKNGVLSTLFQGLPPIALTRPVDVGEKVIEAIDDERYGREVVTEMFPLVKQSARALNNMEFLPREIREISEFATERKPQD